MIISGLMFRNLPDKTLRVKTEIRENNNNFSTAIVNKHH